MSNDSTGAMSPNGGPFQHPAHAQAFAMVVRLNEAGHFTWEEWVRVFSEEISRSPTRSDETTDQAYYRQWVKALEQLLVNRGIIVEGETAARASVWRQAYINTPHGQPVALGNAACAPSRLHHHSVIRGPVAISMAIEAPVI
jgi:nitrile hydratase accessory protein